MVWRGDRHEDSELDEQPVEREHFVDPDGTEEDVDRSIFGSGWFRAAITVAALAVALMLALPYVLDWLEAPGTPLKEPIVARPAPRLSHAPASAPTVKAASARPVADTLPKTSAPAPTPEKSVTRATPVLPPREPRSPSPEAPRMAAPAATPHEVAVLPKSRRGGEGTRGHWVQLGLFRDYRNAERFAESVRGQGFPVDVTSVTRTAPDGGTYHVVRAGAFSDEARAAAVRDDLRSRGYAGFLTEGAAK
jgi:cell division septation protein DedD